MTLIKWYNKLLELKLITYKYSVLSLDFFITNIIINNVHYLIINNISDMNNVIITLTNSKYLVYLISMCI